MPPPPPPVRIDTRVVEPDEQWKADLRKRIEHDLLHMVKDAQIVRDTILNSRLSESSRERAQRDYEESMNIIRTLAQEEFTRHLRQEMSERKWALDVVSSNSPEVARQQQWILDNIRKADEEHTPFPPTDSPQNAEGVLSASPRQQSDSEQVLNGKSGKGYGTGGLEDEEGESEELGDDDDDMDDPHRHPRWWHGSKGSQPYSPGGAPRRQSSGSQASVWRPSPRTPEPSGISRTFAHVNGQAYNTGPVQFPRRGSVNSAGSTSSGAGLHRAGSINSDQYRSSRVAPHGGSERPSMHSRDRIASNTSITPRERQTSASASPHNRPSPPTFPTAPRAIPRGPTAPEEGPRGISWGFLYSRRPLGDFSIHRRHNSKGEQRLPPVDGDLSDASDDVVGHLDDRLGQSVCSAMNIEQLTAWWETEARRREEEANRKEEEASGKGEEARRLEEKARQSLEEARRLEACSRQADASAKVREAAVQSKEAEFKHKEAEAEKREAAAQKREAEAQRKEEVARHRELEARRMEEQAKRKEDDARKREEEFRRKDDVARRREEDARQREMLARQKEEDARRFEEDARKKEEAMRRKEEAELTEEEYERKKREIERKEAELKKRGAELLLLLKENAARLAQEEAARQALESSRLEPKEPSRDDEDTSRLEDGRWESKAQANWQKEKALEERRRQKELEEERQRIKEQGLLKEERPRLEEQRLHEELRREREEQIRLDEVLSRQEQERLERETLLRLLAEAQEREAIRLQEERRRVVEKERLRVFEEQRRKADEKNRQRDELEETLRQRAKEEQQREFQRREAHYYQRRLESERQNSIGASSESWATRHRSGSTTGSSGIRSSTSDSVLPPVRRGQVDRPR
jgi:hypothetical protein